MLLPEPLDDVTFAIIQDIPHTIARCPYARIARNMVINIVLVPNEYGIHPN